jgi:hypothetical protein
MKINRIWVEIVILGTMTACALALLIASLGAAAGAASGAQVQQPSQASPEQANQPSAQQTYQGMVTCSHCGAKHPAALGRTATDCVRICVHGGASFSLVDGDQTYILDGNLSALKKVAGQRAHIVGAMSGKTIRVASVTAS